MHTTFEIVGAKFHGFVPVKRIEKSNHVTLTHDLHWSTMKEVMLQDKLDHGTVTIKGSAIFEFLETLAANHLI